MVQLQHPGVLPVLWHFTESGGLRALSAFSFTLRAGFMTTAVAVALWMTSAVVGALSARLGWFGEVGGLLLVPTWGTTAEETGATGSYSLGGGGLFILTQWWWFTQ